MSVQQMSNWSGIVGKVSAAEARRVGNESNLPARTGVCRFVPESPKVEAEGIEPSS